jgi:hypothetical protein
MEEFFQFDDAVPTPVNSYLWVIAWMFLIILWIFLTYWCLLWAVSNSRLTAVSWSLQMTFVLMQECFVNENLQVLIRNVLVVESLRAQVNRIVDVLNTVLVTKVVEMEEIQDNKGAKKVEGFNVAQHMSASCRVARKPMLCNLIASKVLMLINDHDVALCRETRLTRVGAITKMIITIPSILAFSHESVQQCFLDVLIPTVWCCFVLANAILWEISPPLMFIPYVVIVIALLYRYCYVVPQRRRRRQYDQAMLEQNKSTRKSEFSSSFEEVQDSEENMWRNMNLNLSLTSHEEFIPPPAPEFSFLQRENFAGLNVPDEISEQRVDDRDSKSFYQPPQGRESGFTQLVNEHVWLVEEESCSEEGELDDSRRRGWLTDEWNIVFGSFRSKPRAPLIKSQSTLSLPALQPTALKTSQSLPDVPSLQPNSPASSEKPLTRKLAKSDSSPARGYVKQSNLNRYLSEKDAANLQHPTPPATKPLQTTRSLSRMRSSPEITKMLKPRRSLKKMVSQASLDQSPTMTGTVTASEVDMRLMAMSTRYQSKKRLNPKAEEELASSVAPMKQHSFTVLKHGNSLAGLWSDEGDMSQSHSGSGIVEVDELNPSARVSSSSESREVNDTTLWDEFRSASESSSVKSRTLKDMQLVAAKLNLGDDNDEVGDVAEL